MRPIHLIVLLALAAALCVGCGGGGNPNAPGQGWASATITIEWPQPERLIPLAANSIKIEVSDETGFNASQIVDRPPEGGTSTVVFDRVPVGTLTVTATAYPEAGGLGTAQATGSTTKTTVAGENVSVGLTMASTIDRVDIAPASPFVYVGETVQLTASAKNAAGQVVLTAPGKITWRSASTGVATVDASGLVTGVSWNTTDVTATETESGKSATVTATVDLRPVLFSGPIAGNVTWSGRMRLTGDVTIPATATLTIQPGTVVECEPLADDQIGGIHTSRTEIIVDQGTLTAEGTEANPILFTSAAATPAKGDWYGLRLVRGTAMVRYCIMEYGIDGVRIEGGTPTVEYCTIQHNQNSGVGLAVSASLNRLTVTDCATGILVDSDQTLTLTGSTISNNGGDGVCAPWYGTVSVTGSTISNNGGDGVFAYLGTARVTNSTLSNNGGTGVYAWEGTATVSNSTISGNGRDGVNAMVGTASVTSSTISNNAGWGVLGGTASVTSSTVSNNRGDGVYGGPASVTNSILSGNGGAGLSVGSVGTGGISGNLVYGNRYGIQVYSSDPLLTLSTGNDIFGNTEYELRNAGSAAVSPNGNYWGEPTTTELNSGQVNLTKIYDSRDDANVGQVVISQWSPDRLTTFPLP